MTKFIIEGETTKLELVRKDGTVLYATIDTEDLPRIQALNITWVAHWCPDTKSYYAVGKKKIDKNKYRTIKLSRVILNNPDGLIADHINHDTLDNRKFNLRPASALINTQNKKGARVDNYSSGVRGVTWSNKLKKWRAVFQFNYQKHHIGYFDTISEAAEAVELSRKEYMKNLIETSS